MNDKQIINKLRKVRRQVIDNRSIRCLISFFRVSTSTNITTEQGPAQGKELQIEKEEEPGWACSVQKGTAMYGSPSPKAPN